jgi:hypothetical protein
MDEMSGFSLDSEASRGAEQSALVYAPRHGRGRGRFQASCVRLMPSDDQALHEADAGGHWYAARVVGPAKSSEGFMMFYLVRWLE